MITSAGAAQHPGGAGEWGRESNGAASFAAVFITAQSSTLCSPSR